MIVDLEHIDVTIDLQRQICLRDKDLFRQKRFQLYKEGNWFEGQEPKTVKYAEEEEFKHGKSLKS